MKEIIKFIILIVIFVALLVVCKLFLDKQTNTAETPYISVNESMNNSENIENNEEVEKMEDGVLQVTSENFEEEVLKSDKKVLVDFYADWCGPCQMLSPIVEAVAKSSTNVKVVRIDVDAVQDVAMNYGVMSIPTLVVIENGKEVKRSVGLISQSQLEELIK